MDVVETRRFSLAVVDIVDIIVVVVDVVVDHAAVDAILISTMTVHI